MAHVFGLPAWCLAAHVVNEHFLADASHDRCIDLLGPGSPPGLALAPFAGAGCPWERGDVNQDGAINIGDPIYLLTHLFNSGPAPLPVPEVGDVNGDGGVDIGDAISLLTFLFNNGPAPVPGPGCP